MSMKFWVPLALSVMLVLTGCGEEQDAPVDEKSESQQMDEASPAETSQSETASSAEDAAQSERAARDAEAEQAPSATESASDPSAGVASEASQEEMSSSFEAGENSDVLEESETMPGETSSEDVEAIIQQTEQRFDEASQKIDEQFEKAEQQTPETTTPEAGGAADLDAALEPSSELPEDPASLEGASSDPEVQEILEETEQRFQEASQKIDQQFEQAESKMPEEVNDSTPIEPTSPEGEVEETP